MKERPILFSAPMIRAILEGRKTMTRRVIKGKYADPVSGLDKTFTRMHCIYGQPGDRLWTRETWQYTDWTEDGYPYIAYAADNKVLMREYPEDWTNRVEDIWAKLSLPENYDIDRKASDRKWRPSIFMPRWASRMNLEITSIRVERLNDISEGDARAEGIANGGCLECGNDEPCGCDNPSPDARDAFINLWGSINGHDSWLENPWVWVVEFRRLAK